MKLRILLYKSKLGDGHWIDDAISAWTAIFNWGTGAYSHAEMWEPDESGRFGHVVFDCDAECVTSLSKDGTLSATYTLPIYHYAAYGTTYTSTMRGDINGNVCRPAREVLTHPERWDYVEIEVADLLFEYAKAKADKRVANNKGYSKKDLARFFMPLWTLKLLGLYDKDKQICSEEVALWLFDMYVFGDFDPLISPRRLSRKLVKRGYKIKKPKGA